jgi:thiol:disulfide interchange protein/DsbC/DsbD-like thiol-disulfide interchange protein
MTKFLHILLLFFTLTSFAQDKGDELADMGVQSIVVDNQVYLAVTLKNEDHWHTYWKNPGDSGLPTKISVAFYNNPLQLEMMEWPVPHKYIEQGNILAYGYEGTHTFFYKISSKDLRTLTVPFKVTANYLICKNICIPGKGEVQGKFIGEKFHPIKGQEIELSEKNLMMSLEKIPRKIAKPDDIEMYLMKGKRENTLWLHYSLKNADVNSFNKKMNLLTPFPAPPFGYKHEKVYFDQKQKILYGMIEIEWDGDLQEPEIPFPQDGRFENAIKANFLVNKPGFKRLDYFEYSFTDFALSGQDPLERYFATITEVGEDSLGAPASGSSNKDKSLMVMILLALLGGLILNLMPCVLPVISLKLFGLIKHSQAPRSKLIKHNLSYTAGVISSFWVIAAVVIGLKSAGENIGWGFQLQSPSFVLVMLLLLFVFTMNLFGLFEFFVPGGRLLGGAKLKDGMVGDFFSGVLATILATPCSAPFLGTALSFAFTTGTASILIIFTFVGVGLSIPFILTGFFPGLIAFLPKPGQWMDNLKKFLGLALLLTCAWLYDILLSLVDGSLFNFYLNAILIFVFFGVYFYNKMSDSRFFRLLFIIVPLFIIGYVLGNSEIYMSAPAESASTSTTTSSGVTWNKWTEDKMMSVANQYVFVDFTAQWCLTCKVNKKLVLDTDDFKALTEKHNIKLFRADWTKRDESITNFLKRYEIVGVPAYFIKKPDGTIISLGETVTISKLKEYLK